MGGPEEGGGHGSAAALVCTEDSRQWKPLFKKIK